MGDLADVYEATRRSISGIVSELAPAELERRVPATPEWTIKDVVAHLAGDVSCVLAGDFPAEFFMGFGEEAAVAVLNSWTADQVTSRDGRPLQELLAEWDKSAGRLTGMMRGEEAWPEGMPPFVDRVLVTDVGVHLQDLCGALGLERDRDGAPVRIGLGGYVAMMDLRLRQAGEAALRVEVEDKAWTPGGDEPGATVRSDRWELFRAMSGRRNPEQIRAYEWDGDPEPYLEYFYPYGIRSEALVE